MNQDSTYKSIYFYNNFPEAWLPKAVISGLIETPSVLAKRFLVVSVKRQVELEMKALKVL